ncbi:pantoate--beta-alanine ligase [Aeromicrobium sp. Sec7.5]|uniref:pantoate--beta-alanine ligase n=1 Tax=Aeromicrobium sp. Sec7.5 TaxID=3121276 RepID=UPI002FE4BF4F
MSIRVVRTAAELRGLDGTIALVPTMGALHDGHVQLMKHACPLADTLVASIFVNPTQFGAGEDFGEYPRTWDADLERCEEAGVDAVFAPEVATMYPHGLVNQVMVDPGPLGAILEGEQRPTHFRGVLTVVAKLFGLVRPDVAVFGEKDYQQLALIRLMVETLCLDVEVVGCPTVREVDGLAMSSRNRYLTRDERTRAVALSQALDAGVAAGPHGPDDVRAAALARLADFGVVPDYVALTSPDLGEPVPGEARLLIAARVGKPRLLDNRALTLGPDALGHAPEGS